MRSLPRRQLRNCRCCRPATRWSFAAAQAAQKCTSHDAHVCLKFAAAQAAQKLCRWSCAIASTFAAAQAAQKRLS